MLQASACCKPPAQASLCLLVVSAVANHFHPFTPMVLSDGFTFTWFQSPGFITFPIHIHAARSVPSFSSSSTISGGSGFCPAAISSLQDSISQKFQSLDSKFQALESSSKETLEFLNNGDNSIPERESATAARIEEQKEASLADIRNALSPSTLKISDALKSLSRKMDASTLLQFIISV